MADLYRQGHARTSVARKLSALRAFGRYLRREGWIESDPAALAVGPRREQKIPAHLSVDEMSRLLDMPDASTALGRRDRAILELFYASGLRLSELVGLDLDEVNLRARMVRVMGKGAKERLVPFNTASEQSIRAWLADRATLRQGPKPKAHGTKPRAESREPRPRIPCSSTPAGLASPAEVFNVSLRGMCRRAARDSASARTRCGIPLPRTCCSVAPTFGRSRSCSVTCNCQRRSVIRTSTPHSCWTCTGRRTRGRSGREALRLWALGYGLGKGAREPKAQSPEPVATR
jgi:hypothetical protein